MWACRLLQGAQLRWTRGTVQSQRQTFPKHSLRDLQPPGHLSAIDWVQAEKAVRCILTQDEEQKWTQLVLGRLSCTRGCCGSARCPDTVLCFPTQCVHPECKVKYTCSVCKGRIFFREKHRKSVWYRFFEQIAHRLVKYYLFISNRTHTHTYVFVSLNVRITHLKWNHNWIWDLCVARYGAFLPRHRRIRHNLPFTVAFMQFHENMANATS